METKEEAEEVAIAKANSLEEQTSSYVTRLEKYRQIITALHGDVAKLKAKQESNDHVECKKAIAAKEKMIRQAQDGKKLLAKRIEQIENTVVAENSGLSQQHKSANDKLKNKTKELKDASTEIKQVD